MKSEGQVKQKLKQVIYRHRASHVEHGMARRPENCTYNRLVRLPVHTGNRATIRVCGYRPEGAPPLDVVCDPTMAGDEQAENCPYFVCCNTADSLKNAFKTKLGLDGTVVQIGVIAKEYPDVAALMWAVGPAKNVNKKAPADSDGPGILAFFGDQGDEPDEVPERPLVEDVDEP